MTMEIAQSLAALGAWFFAGWRVYEAMLDASAQKAAKDRRASRRILALDHQLSEFSRFVVVTDFVVIGLFRVVLSDDDPRQTFIVSIGLLVATVVLLFDGVRAHIARRDYAGTLIEDDSEAAGLKKIEQEAAAIEENVATIDETVKDLKEKAEKDA